jgi:hypothetical protein
MVAQEPFGVSLADVVAGLEGMSEMDMREYAAVGLLLDWQMVNFLRKAGWTLCRQSFTWRDDEVLMVLKVLVDDTPYVVFVSRQSPIHCVRTFVRKMNEGSVPLYPDKFA